MSNKKPSNRAIDLQQKVEKADLAERQTENQTILNAAEAAEVSGYTVKQARINQLVGAINTTNAFSKVATVATAVAMSEIKNNKLYQGFTLFSLDGKVATVATWEQFCSTVLNMSRRSADDMIANLQAFGPEAMEAMDRAGFGA